MKKLLLSIAVFTLFMSGCTFKNGFFSQDLVAESLLSNTKKGGIYSSLETKATILATYLNNSLQKYKNSDHEVFLINVYIDNDFSEKNKKEIFNPNYSISINGGLKPKNITKLSSDDELLKVIPMQNKWSSYYLVEFDKVPQSKIDLLFKSESYSQTRLSFAKDQ